MEEIKLNLDEKILELKKLVNTLQRDSQGHGYKYVSEEQILLRINDKMIELKVKLTPKIKQGTLTSEIVKYFNAKGQEKTDVKITSEMFYEWKDIETGETEIIDWVLVGQQADSSQAFGSGLTYAGRYFLLKYFNVATSDEDPDKIKSDIEAKEEQRKLSSEQTKLKKLYNKAISKYQTKDALYKKLGTTPEEYKENFGKKENWLNMIEQLELILKEDENVKS